MNTDELEYALSRAERRVLEIQTKLHRWAREDPHRRFSELLQLAHRSGDDRCAQVGTGRLLTEVRLVSTSRASPLLRDRAEEAQ